MNSKDKGDIAESAVIHQLKKKGKSVLIPFGDNDRYDIVVDDKDKLKRVQIKYGSFSNGAINFSCASHQRTDGEKVRTTYTENEIDSFMVYCPEIDKVYEIPVGDAPNTEMRLRVEDPSSNDSKINWAEDYEI